MKFRSLSVALFLLSPLGLLAQYCLPDGITFTRQSQLDSFPIRYPNCTRITGTIDIDGSQDTITSLAGLSQVTHAGSSVRIHQTDLITLDGFSFDSITGDLDIFNNYSLINLNGLEELNHVANDVSIKSNPYLETLAGLNNLVAIGGKLDIQSHNSLTHLHGLSSLKSIDKALFIANSSYLRSLDGLQSLVEIEDLSLSDNKKLSSLHGLQSLTTIRNNVFITGCDSIADLSAIGGVHEINGYIFVTENKNLASLHGLDNMCTYGVDFITLAKNKKLNVCSVSCICEHVQHNGTSYVYDNLPGCNSMVEIKEACLVDTDQLDMDKEIAIHPNPTTNVLFVTGVEDITRHYILYDCIGQLLRQETIATGMISLSQNTPGVYYIMIQGKQGPMPFRVVKI